MASPQHLAQAAEKAANEREAAEEPILTQRAEQTNLIERLLDKQRRSLVGDMEASLQEAMAAKAAAAAELAGLQKERTELMEVLEAQKAEAHRARSEVQQLQLEVASMVSEVAEARADEASIRSDLSKALASVKDLEEANGHFRTVSMELQEARDLVSKLKQDLKEEKGRPTLPPPKEGEDDAKDDKSKKSHVGTSILGKLDLDESLGAPPISEQIASALMGNAGRVLDLFREWDADGNGEISRKEFRKAMPALGL